MIKRNVEVEVVYLPTEDPAPIIIRVFKTLDTEEREVILELASNRRIGGWVAESRLITDFPLWRDAAELAIA